MKRNGLIVALMLIAVAPAVDAQRTDDGPRHNQGGGVNLAPLPAVYTVIATDSYAQTVRMRAQNGDVLTMYVGEDIYDISKLKPGDRIQVNFLEPDGLNNRLAAANVWPVK